MESPELDRISADPSNSRKGPNPNRDYKQHFIRQKQRYDAASSDQVVRTRELNRASLKQMKLQDEIEFLIDAIAGESYRQEKKVSDRRSLSAAKNNSANTAVETTEKEDVKPVIQADDNEPKQNETQQVDDELDDLMQEDTNDTNSRRSGRRSSVRQSRTSAAAAAPTPAPNAESASASGSVKRRRASYSDTDDELLESAGLTSTKRARNE